ncbi:MAG: PilZ domain-containing protein [Halioglobus sp.]
MFNGRRHKRVVIDEDLVLQPQFKAKNISESGMLLKLSEPIPVGKLIELTLCLDGKQYNTVAFVRRCAAATSIFDHGYDAGVEFKGHSIGMQLAIRAHINRLAE